MSEQCIVPAVLLSVLETQRAGCGRGRARAVVIDVAHGGIDELVLEKYKATLPPNHPWLIGECAELSRLASAGGNIRARCYGTCRSALFLDSMSGKDMQCDFFAIKCIDHLLYDTLVVVSGVERQVRIE